MNSEKMAVGGYEDTDPSHTNAADLKAKGQLKVGRSVIFKPVNEGSLTDSSFNQNAQAGEMVYTDQDKFYHYNGSTWQSQSGGSSGLVIYTSCAWRYDYKEGVVGIGAAANWGCIPPVCPAAGGTWLDLGIIANDPASIACGVSDSGTGSICDWDGTTGTNNALAPSRHPITVGRSLRACLKQ